MWSQCAANVDAKVKCWALSVRDDQNGKPVVRHYKIKRDVRTTGVLFYITAQKMLPSFAELVDYYRSISFDLLSFYIPKQFCYFYHK